MTAQIREVILYREKKCSMCAEPLAAYFRLSGNLPAFQESSTALWRRYVGQWEITNGRLYLVGISARFEDGTEATLNDMFPGFAERVFAHWFTGTLRIPHGEMLQYVHMGYASTYEHDLLIAVDGGVVIGESTRSNAKSTR